MTAVAAASFSPDDFVDRKKEQELFDELLSLQDEARLLTICDEGARGKSHLLKLLRHKCRIAQAPVPVSLVPLDELQEKTPYAVVKQIVRSLKRFGVQFDGYEKARNKRFESRSGSAGGLIRGEAHADESHGGQIAGVIIDGNVTINTGVVDSEYDEWLRDQAVEAFVEDLRRFCADQTVVILLDAYEHSSEELGGGDLREWIQEFLCDNVLDVGSRPDKLVVVVAGQEVPTIESVRQTLHDSFDQLVRSVEALSIWGPDDVRKFFDLNQIRDYAEEDIEYFLRKLERGWAIGKAHDFISLWQRDQ